MERLLILACGALVKELQALVKANGLTNVTIECLPAELHNHPGDIPDLLATRIERNLEHYDRILVGYADCGTVGQIDAVCDRYNLERLAGEHCFQFFAGATTFAALQDAEPGTFYLTDFLARHFDLLIMQGLGIERHPELLALYFGNYTRLIYLAQTADEALVSRARAAADQLGLRFELRASGYGELAPAIVSFGKTRTSATENEKVATS